MQKVNSKLLFCFSLTTTNVGLEEMTSELDASVCTFKEKPYPNFNVVVLNATLGKIRRALKELMPLNKLLP